VSEISAIEGELLDVGALEHLTQIMGDKLIRDNGM
jgi:hypothetical protein